MDTCISFLPCILVWQKWLVSTYCTNLAHLRNDDALLMIQAIHETEPIKFDFSKLWVLVIILILIEIYNLSKVVPIPFRVYLLWWCVPLERADLTPQTQQLSSMNIVVDKMHMRGHTDAWCKDNCDPHKFPQLEKVCNVYSQFEVLLTYKFQWGCVIYLAGRIFFLLVLNLAGLCANAGGYGGVWASIFMAFTL